MDVGLIVLVSIVVVVGVLAAWGAVGAFRSARRRRRVDRDPRAVWKGGRKVLPEDLKRVRYRDTDGRSNPRSYPGTGTGTDTENTL
ncbi:hypothetical protein AB0I28_23040 [Phytomonospora sp. NPDC050363]|uniref:hypothetical protein n=1 Tax=Phytomonospora sp. NPDC050363 TaxID=3155642 RepID=UPI0034105A45